MANKTLLETATNTAGFKAIWKLWKNKIILRHKWENINSYFISGHLLYLH